MSTDDLHRLMSVDPLAEAERITGTSYKEDESTTALGVAMHLAHNRVKERALLDAGDTWFGSTLAEHLEVFARLGFAEVHRETFTGKAWSNEPGPEETFHILWHPDGILGKAESYGTTRRNTADIYYNWRPSDDTEDTWAYTSSGGMHRESYDRGERIWVGHHDVREGMVTKVTRLREAGTFVAPWVEPPFLWLLTYMDTEVEDYDYEALNRKRIAALPSHVQDAISGGAS